MPAISLSALTRPVLALALLVSLLLVPDAFAGEAARFVGTYQGSAELQRADGTTEMRDMDVMIEETKDGFTVSWSTTIQKPDGRIKESDYSVDFLPSTRDGVYAAAMRRNVFGHTVQLDPMKGEPYVWGRIAGDTLTVFSLFVADDGGYEMQQFDRTLAEGGLILNFSRVKNGRPAKSVETFLQKQ
ncbi:hypothetical protein KBY31_10315 [Ruegeria pomeroyi]|uniref:hypothetical protein n=1 Tax=Ruegeria pomeroyi TaxID=89184 RepID=UPI001F157575|nr:hypothetical protein [Ruegeria pomeroyi]MCE8507023.1 hypothetical protein [Ruegeria pomeroyi]MCE8517111.1 hypothetical protein [Ruegeria pomeroyi]